MHILHTIITSTVRSRYTQNATTLKRYFPIVAQTLVFFMHHYTNRTAEGELVIWPTQSLET